MKSWMTYVCLPWENLVWLTRRYKSSLDRLLTNHWWISLLGCFRLPVGAPWITGGILLWGCTLGGVYIPCIYSHASWSYRRRFRSLCCCVPCLSSAIMSLCLLILHKHCRPHSVSDYINSLWDQRVNACMCVFTCWAFFEILGLCPVSNENWFCRMSVHTCAAECAWNGGFICHWGHLFLRVYFWCCLYTLYLLARQVELP